MIRIDVQCLGSNASENDLEKYADALVRFFSERDLDISIYSRGWALEIESEDLSDEELEDYLGENFETLLVEMMENTK
jgi:hypothetical protein